ncbi:glycosyltransferase family 2 protein [Dyadobacter arcticus]|uniref:Glycosyltransferase involved in cell wall biosynthesis n=1 Tax=Dyadobacter arcticus TaxID=1078754 RepID=A0ABX0UW87_9BACT|nr:glycosyltransferase [Dyadobacter arcticus]NIJ56075.1 glycosyltransferase involved in cell wall biosynthesis [Dyadobacter arcticus]
MKVSVCVPTYNHERYIAQMLDGALMQQTDFTFEIVIGDDASSDSSPTIIREYAQKHPGKIRAFLHSENQGPKEPREFAGRNNVLQLLKTCRGEYVAMCEGDDFWTDPMKLQKQVDFLDDHPDFSICHHNMLVIYEDGSPEHSFNKPDQKPVSTIVDILEDRWFMATASWMYRNHFLAHDFADWHAKAAAGDWAIMIQIAATGRIGYLPEMMGVYRKHSAGLSHVHSHSNQKFLQNRKEMFENVDHWLNYKYHGTIEKTLATYTERLAAF